MSSRLALIGLIFVAAPAEAADWPDVSGRWARAQKTTALVDVPFVGETAVRTLTITIADVTQEEDRLVLTESVCAIESEPVSPLVKMKYPAAFLRAASGGVTKALLKREGTAVRYVEPRNERIVGAKDEDGDGHPGVTVRVEGMVDGEVYVRQRGWQTAKGRLLSERRISGRVTIGVEQKILGASRSMLEDAPPSRPHPDPKRHVFRMAKVPEGADCRDVLARRTKLLGT